MNEIQKRIIDISYKNKFGSLSATISAAPIIEEIYKTKKENEPFILSSGHAGLALYCVLEKFLNKDAEQLFHKHGMHPHRDVDDGIQCSTGSLGMGLTVACGYALADRTKNVYCLISDGECCEGSIWEALRFIKEKGLSNLKVYVNINGMMAYDFIDTEYLKSRLISFLPDIQIRETKPLDWNFASGIVTHYYTLKEDDLRSL